MPKHLSSRQLSHLHQVLTKPTFTVERRRNGRCGPRLTPDHLGVFKIDSFDNSPAKEAMASHHASGNPRFPELRFLRIPMKGATDSNPKPATFSGRKPTTHPHGYRQGQMYAHIVAAWVGASG